MRATKTIQLKDELLLIQEEEERQSQNQNTGPGKGKKEKAQAQEPGKKKTFGEDIGKIVRFTEFPALKLEKFYIQLYGIIYAAAEEQQKKDLEEAKNSQSAALAVNTSAAGAAIMDQVSGQLQYVELLNEFFSCFEYYEKSLDRYIPLNKDNVNDYIVTITATQYLRDYAARENLKHFQ